MGTSQENYILCAIDRLRVNPGREGSIPVSESCLAGGARQYKTFLEEMLECPVDPNELARAVDSGKLKLVLS